MKVVCLDIESTDLDVSIAQAIGLGAVIVDLETDTLEDVASLPAFEAYISHPEYHSLRPRALVMNANIFEKIANVVEGSADFGEESQVYHHYEVVDLFVDFLSKYYDQPIINRSGDVLLNTRKNDTKKYVINVAGKNAPFLDIPLIRNLPKFDDNVLIRKRVFDPAQL